MSDVDAKANAAREASQKKTFTRWANHYMAERMLKINDLFVDLKDGILLINLMELISSKNLGRYEKRPRMELQMLGNIDVALKFITSEGIKLVNIGPKDIYIGNPKLILGLIWTLILRYQINLGDSSPKQELINWVNKQIKPYQKKGVDPIVNFTSSLQDGKALAALADSLSPGLTEIDTDDLADALKNVQNCLTVSERDYNIPPLLDAVDVVNNPDEHSAMTYISYFRDYLENKAKDSNVYKTKGAHAESSYVTGRGVGEKGKGNLFRGRAQPFVIHSKNVGGEYVTTAKWKCVYTVQVTGPNGPVQHDMKDMEDGTYQGCYVPDTVGEFKISVVQEGKYGIPDAHVRGSVFSVNVLEGADPSKSYAEGPGLTNAFDDAPATFTVHCLDYTGTPVVGEDTLAVAIEAIKRDGAALEKKAAAPPPAKAALCEHCGDKLVPGKKFCEHCGSKVPAGPPAAAAAVRPGTIVPKIKDNGDGTYSVEYLAPIPGDYDLNVTVDNQAIKDMPSKLKVHRGIDASKTYAEGRGVNSPGFLGREHPFTVHTVDRDGKELKSGGGTFKTTVSGPSGPIPCTLKDNGDGTYSGNYTPKELGNHVVDIKLNKGDHLEPIKGNPFKLTVKKPADLSKSYAEGEGVHNAADNRPAKFKVFAKDEDGKPVSGEWLDVKITPKGDDPKGQSIFPVDIKDNGDGTYDVQYEAKDVGDYNMNVEIAESPIKDMPTELHVHAGVDPSKCVVEGPGVEGGPRGKDLPFIVRAMDKQGKPVNFGGDDFKVQVVGPDGKKVPCELKDNGDGTYSGHYVPQSTGIYTVDLTVNDNPTHVGKAPYKCKVRAGTGNSYAEGPGLAHAFDDVPGRFTVHCFDTDGKPVAGEDSLAVSILLAKKLDVVAAKPPPSPAAVSGKCSDCGAVNVGKKFCESCGSKLAAPPPPAAASPASRTENPIVSPVIKDNNDGTYAVEYKATVAGEYDLNIVVDNASIKDMPSKLKVHRGIDASKTYAEGRGVNSPGFLGREHPFTVHTVDRDGNKVNVGGAEFKVSVNGPHGPIACELKDNGDGTYSGNYTPKELGNHVVDIKLNKGDRLEPIKGNPFKLTVKKPADLSKSYAEGEGVHNAADNRPGKFKVFAKDEDGKPVSGEWLDVKITPKGDDPKGQSIFPVDIKDNGDGTYDVQYEAKDVGDYNMNVEIAESPIKDMPTELHVHAGVDPSKCVVEGPGVEGGLANRDLPFTVHAKDGNGKPVKFGGDDFQVQVVGPDGKKVPCELKDNGDGTYSGSYHPNAPGDYIVDLTVNDNPTHVGKAPYKCKVKPAGDASKSYAKGKGWRYCYDNQPASFKVYVKDAKGQPVSGEVLHVAMSDKTSQQYKDALAARIAKVDPYMLKKKADQYAATAVQTPQDLKEGDVPTTVTDNHDGTYTVNYTAIIPGEYEMNVQVQGKPIKDAPKVIKCLWSCPNEPCAHTMEELHQQLAEQRDQIYQLQKKVAQLSGTPFEERGYDNENDP